jgi:hypothetical protein
MKLTHKPRRLTLGTLKQMTPRLLEILRPMTLKPKRTKTRKSVPKWRENWSKR